jgi:hypothetical protein
MVLNIILYGPEREEKMEIEENCIMKVPKNNTPPNVTRVIKSTCVEHAARMGGRKANTNLCP